jgi:hypothetical protein
MARWITDGRNYTLPEGLEDIGETFSGTQTNLGELGFGSEQNQPGRLQIQAAKDDGGTVVFIAFWYLGGRNFGLQISCYIASPSPGNDEYTLLASVIKVIEFPVP